MNCIFCILRKYQFLLFVASLLFMSACFRSNQSSQISTIQDPCKDIEPMYIGKKGEIAGENIMNCFDYVVISYAKFKGSSL